MKKESETPSNSPPSDETFAAAAKLLEGKSDVLDNILASMGDGLSIQDRNMRIVYQNKFMIDNFGSHIGEFCYNIYEGRKSLCEGCPIVEAYRTQKVTKALRVGTTKDGEQFRFENIASILRNHQGEIVAGIELVRIVEDRERALDELRAAMKRLDQAKAVYESSSEGIMVVDRDNRIISVNPAFKYITGYSYDEIMGADPYILRSGRHTAEFYAEIRRSLQETGTWRGEIWNQRKNGQVYLQLMLIDTILGDDGEVSKRVCIFSDITEKKLAEEALRESESRVRAIADSAQDAILMMDPEGRISYWNPAAERILGYTSTEAIGQNLHALIVPSRYHESHHAAFPVFQRNGEGAAVGKRLDLEAIRKDGEEISVQLSLSAIHMKGAWHAVGVLRDVTESKRVEKALQENRRRLADIIEFLPDATLAIDSEKRVILWNKAIEEMTGIPAAEMIGKGDHAYSIPFYGEARPQLMDLVFLDYKEIAARYPSISREGDSITAEAFCDALYNNKGAWVFAKASPLHDQSGNIVGVIESIRDITEQKRLEKALQKREEEYRTLVDNASDIIFRADITGHFTFMNPVTFHITGYEEEELIGRNYSTLIRPDMRDETIKFFGRQFVKGIQETYLEYPILTKEGHEVWLGQNTQLVMVDGHAVGFQAVARDIGDRKRMEAEILSLSITDQLTGLNNRRGFLSLAGQQLKLAERKKNGVLFFFADLDGLKWINDTLGHEEGDKALIEAADVFKETFRASDIIARLGGDEYATLAVDVNEASSEIFTARLKSLIDARNKQENRRYRLSISVGCSYYNPENPCSIDELMASADKLMYEQKQIKKALLPQGASLSSSNHHPSMNDESKDR